MAEYSVPGKSKDLEKYVTNKEDAKLKKNMLPPDEYRVKKDDERIIRESIKIIRSDNHGAPGNKDPNWHDYGRQVMTPMGPGEMPVLKDPKPRKTIEERKGELEERKVEAGESD